MNSYNYNFNVNSITALIEDGYIYEWNLANNTKTIIGVTKDTYNSLVDEHDKNLNLLYDNKILDRPKTQEEINQERDKALSDTLALLKEQSEIINKLKKEVEKYGDKSTNDN